MYSAELVLNENEWVSNPPEPFVNFNETPLQLPLSSVFPKLTNEALVFPFKSYVKPPADGFNTAAIWC